MTEEESEQLRRAKAVLPPGLKAFEGEAGEPNTSEVILEGMRDRDIPWDSPPFVVAMHEHEGEIHPMFMIPMVGWSKDGSDSIPVSIPGLVDYLPDFPPPDPIVALGYVVEIYIGKRKSENPDTYDDGIGDKPGDLEARIVMVKFAGGGEQRAIHLREANIIARWGEPGEVEHSQFRTVASSPKDANVMKELADLLVRINNP